MYHAQYKLGYIQHQTMERDYIIDFYNNNCEVIYFIESKGYTKHIRFLEWIAFDSWYQTNKNAGKNSWYFDAEQTYFIRTLLKLPQSLFDFCTGEIVCTVSTHVSK